MFGTMLAGRNPPEQESFPQVFDDEEAENLKGICLPEVADRDGAGMGGEVCHIGTIYRVEARERNGISRKLPEKRSLVW